MTDAPVDPDELVPDDNNGTTDTDETDDVAPEDT
jgi:hypothetical protein